MSYKEDLEEYIHASYKLIRDYETIIRLSDIPKEKARSQITIDEQWALIKSHLDEYIPLCKRLHLLIANDLKEIIIRFPEYLDSEELQSISVSTQKPSTIIEVFFSYAHEDEELRDKLAKHLSLLQREGLIKAWHDRQISAGRDWAGEISLYLNTARIILLLLSPDFIASDYCYDIEMKQAMKRHETGYVRVIPIILRPVDWQQAPFSKLRALPKDGIPVTMWSNLDEAFLDVATELRKVVRELSNTK